MGQKGGKAERDLCRTLTKWVTGKENPPIYWRNGGSGSVSTVALKANKEAGIVGDIAPIDTRAVFLTGLFGIENKRGYGFKLDDLLIDFPLRKTSKGLPDTHILMWWQKHKLQCHVVNRSPLLIAKKDFYPTYIFYDEYCNSLMCQYFHPPRRAVRGIDLDGDAIWACLFSAWMDIVDPHTLREIYDAGEASKWGR